MSTTEHVNFASVDDAYRACEEAGLEPRIQHGGLNEVVYYVYVNGHYIALWSDKDFLRWANTFFNVDWDAIYGQEDEE